jgi:hypothetical protein
MLQRPSALRVEMGGSVLLPAPGEQHHLVVRHDGWKDIE